MRQRRLGNIRSVSYWPMKMRARSRRWPPIARRQRDSAGIERASGHERDAENQPRNDGEALRSIAGREAGDDEACAHQGIESEQREPRRVDERPAKRRERHATKGDGRSTGQPDAEAGALLKTGWFWPSQRGRRYRRSCRPAGSSPSDDEIAARDAPPRKARTGDPGVGVPLELRAPSGAGRAEPGRRRRSRSRPANCSSRSPRSPRRQSMRGTDPTETPACSC